MFVMLALRSSFPTTRFERGAAFVLGTAAIASGLYLFALSAQLLFDHLELPSLLTTNRF
jgi:hypothetical protein